MPRRPRVVAVDVPHHITQRGNNRQTVFLTDADRLSYLDTLRRKCREHSLALLGWCLMPNHVHLVAIPAHQHSIARAIGQTHHTFALHANRLRRRSGHFWQNRFYSCPVGPSHLIEALAYVDLNPVRARLAHTPTAFPWSSARPHLAHHDPADLLDLFHWSDIDRHHDWAEVLAARPAGRHFRRSLHAAERRGTPLGDQPFIDALTSKHAAAQAAGA